MAQTHLGFQELWVEHPLRPTSAMIAVAGVDNVAMAALPSPLRYQLLNLKSDM